MYSITHFRIVKEDVSFDDFNSIAKSVMDFVNDPAAPVKALLTSCSTAGDDFCDMILLAELDMDDPRLARLEELMAAKAVPADDANIQ
jgi:hypothetical protein